MRMIGWIGKTGVLLALLALPGMAQDVDENTATGAEAAPLAAAPGPIESWADPASLESHLLEQVKIHGVSGKVELNPQQTVVVWLLTDRYGNAVWVRTPAQKAPEQYRQYDIVGTVVKRPDGKFEIIEVPELRDGGGGPPPPPPPHRDDGLTKQQKLMLAGGALIFLAGLVLVIMLRQQSQAQARAQAMAQEAQARAAAERQRDMERQLEAERRPATSPETVLAGGAGAASAGGSGGRGTTITTLGKLTAQSGPHTGEVFPLASHVNVIGRDGADLNLAKDETVSRRHAKVVFNQSGRVALVDESRNGSRVNGESVHQTEHVLNDGDVIEIGLTTLQFKSFRGDSPAEPAPASEQRRAETVIRPVAGAAPAAPADAKRAVTAMFLGAEVEVIEGPDQGKTFPLQATRTRFGRQDGQELELTDATVSREHGLILHENGEFVLSNLSSQGTKVNGESTERCALANDDVIELGGTKLVFRKLK